MSFAITGEIEPFGGSGEKGGFSPSDLRSAYKLPATGGSGQTVAIVDAFNDPNAESDLKTYRSHYGLSECTKANGCFKKVNQAGEEANYPANNVGWSVEMSLDLDMVSAVCPECHIVLVEATTNSFANMDAAENKAAALTGTTEISDSWGAPEVTNRTSEDSYFNHPGIPILVSSGDYCYNNECRGSKAPNWPSTSKYVVSVGGTKLETAANSRGWKERVWYEAGRAIGTGSGCSIYESKPSWETDAGCSKRTDTDVSAVGACESPLSIYDSYEQEGWFNECGTSASAPILAGVEALSSKSVRELGAEAFYKTGPAGGLFDVTEGSNGSCGSSYLCTAKTGYDGPTGWGTPNGVINVAPSVTTGTATGIATTEATLHGTVNPNGLETKYYFEYGKTTSYGTKTAEVSAGAGTSGVEESKTITGLSPETTYHFRIVASNSGGTTKGSDQEFSALAVTPSSLYTFGKGYGTENGQFKWPKGIAVDQNGDVWVSDHTLDRVQEFTESGEYLRQFGSEGSGNGQFIHPNGIAITASGNLWVVDAGNDRIQEFNSKGEYLGQFGTSGTGNGQFSSPTDITIAPDGSIWVSDKGNDNVQKFSASGEFLLKSGSEGTGNGQFKEPTGIAAESDGSVWIVDHGNVRMQKLSSSGSFLTAFGSKGSGAGQFQNPTDVVVKPSGNLLVAEAEPNHRVQELSQNGQFLAEIYEWIPEEIALGRGGRFFIPQGSSRLIHVWSQPAAPEAATEPASSIKTTEATLNGSVNPSALETTYHFEYGKTTAYGTSVPVPSESVGKGNEAVAKSKALTGLSLETTYHFRVVAENSEGTTNGEDMTFTTLSTAGALSGMAVTEPFNGGTESLANFGSKWSTLGWAGGTTPKGKDNTTGWGPSDTYSTINGASYSPTVSDTGPGIAAVGTMATNPGNASRYFSLWMDMETPGSTRAGYELRFTDVSTGIYTVTLSKWVSGSQTVLATKESYSFANGNSLALVDKGSTVSAWTNTGSGFGQLLSASDGTFSGGNSGVEGSGNITRLTNFKVGSL